MARHALLSCLTFPYRTHVALHIYWVIQYNFRKKALWLVFASTRARKDFRVTSYCLFAISKEGKVQLMSTLARSGNNVSLIHLEYLLLPNFVNQLFLSFAIWYSNKEGVPKEVWCDICCVYPWICAVQLAVDKRRYISWLVKVVILGKIHVIGKRREKTELLV